MDSKPILRLGRQLDGDVDDGAGDDGDAASLLLLLLAPLVVLFTILIVMVLTDTAVGFGRLVMVGTYSLVPACSPLAQALQLRATRMRKKMQDQFPIALDVFVRGLRAGHGRRRFDLLTVGCRIQSAASSTSSSTKSLMGEGTMRSRTA